MRCCDCDNEAVSNMIQMCEECLNSCGLKKLDYNNGDGAEDSTPRSSLKLSDVEHALSETGGKNGKD